MISFKNISFQKAGRLCCGIAAAVVASMGLTSCEDFFTQESDHIIYADDDHLNAAVDTMYSVVGIMDKLQLLADRTILLGELRGDLVSLTEYAPAYLRQVADFDTPDDNIYNQPRDYYAVINNCNYFLKNANTLLKDSRNEYVFRREYAAVKAYRAWTYLQLALNYGQVRYVTEPILTKQEADDEDRYPMLGIEALCDLLIADLQPLVPAYAREYPRYGTIEGVDTRLSYFPIYVLLGELNLWAGHYRESALAYYNYLSTRNGDAGAYPTGTDQASWGNSVPSVWRYNSVGFVSGVADYYGETAELITMIPISKEYDTVPNLRYNALPKFYNSREDNDYHVSLVPSQALQDLSEQQEYCLVTGSANSGSQRDTVYVPHGLEKNMSGDLRLFDSWLRSENQLGKNNERIDMQYIMKFQSRNVHIWRRQMVYLHMAEALNRAGYPRFAFKILEEGVNDLNIASDVLSYYTTAADSAYILQFSFPQQRYVLASASGAYNQQGLHSRGSGNTTANSYYKFPQFTTGDTLALQIDSIERMIVTEGALEFAFEGQRYYDLMRVALRRGDPAFLADRVYGRRGESQRSVVQGEIKKNLYDKNNWYLNWQGKIGLGQ